MEEDPRVGAEEEDQAKVVEEQEGETEEDSFEVVETVAAEGDLETVVEEAAAEAMDGAVEIVAVDEEEDAADKRSSTIPQLFTP